MEKEYINKVIKAVWNKVSKSNEDMSVIKIYHSNKIGDRTLLKVGSLGVVNFIGIFEVSCGEKELIDHLCYEFRDDKPWRNVFDKKEFNEKMYNVLEYYIERGQIESLAITVDNKCIKSMKEEL